MLCNRRRSQASAYPRRPIESLECRTLFAIPVLGQWALYANDALTVEGLAGTYFDQSLRAETAHADWRATQTVAGTRLDRTINFATTAWGDRATTGVTGGAGSDWDNFSAQWDGYVRVTSGHVNLRTRSDGGSRLYVDYDRDGQFEPENGREYVDNNWGSDPATAAIGESSAALAPGVYPVRVQFEAGAGANIMELQSSVAPTVRVAYLIPSGRRAQANGVANLQYALPVMQEWYREAFARNGLSERTFLYETEADGVTPMIHVVPVAASDAAIRSDPWGTSLNAAQAAGVPIYAQNQVWLLIPEAHLMQPGGNILGNVALGASNGSAGDGGVALVSSDMLHSFAPGMVTRETSYHGAVIPELGPYPLFIGESFDWSAGDSFSGVASTHYGAVVHELTHAMGMPHDFRNDDNADGNLMGNGFRGFRGSLLPAQFPMPYNHVMWGQALVLHNNPYFSNDGRLRPGTPGLTWSISAPVNGQLQITFNATSPLGLGSIILQYEGNQVGEMDLSGASASGTFKSPYYAPGQQKEYALMLYDRFGNRNRQTRLYTPPAGSSQPGVVPHIQSDYHTVRVGEPVEFNTALTTGMNLGNVDVDWDWDFDGVYDTTPDRGGYATAVFNTPGVRMVRARFRNPAGATVESAPLPVRVLPDVAATGAIGGSVFADENGDGMREPTEAPQAGVTVYVDRNHNGVRDAGLEPSAVTGADGTYRIEGLEAGVYLVRAEAPQGLAVSAPVSRGHSVTLFEGRPAGSRDFGIKESVAPRALSGAFLSTGGPHRIEVEFDDDVSASLAPSDLVLRDVGTNLAINPADMDVSFDSQTKRATFTFPRRAGQRLPAGTWRASIAADAVTDRARNALQAPLAFEFTLNSLVAARHVFYNDSAFDGNTAHASSGDDPAVATDKRALRPGGLVTATNYTSYGRGINGVMIDLASIPLTKVPNTTDFIFQTGAGGDAAAWAQAPAPSGVMLRRGAGASGSDRITLVWGDNAVRNAWLRVTVKPTANTGLASADVFYFGNLAGDAADVPGGIEWAAVNTVDYTLARRAAGQTGVGVSNRFDHNRDGAVDAADVLLARVNLGRRLDLNVGEATEELVIAPASARLSPRRPFRPADGVLTS